MAQALLSSTHSLLKEQHQAENVSIFLMATTRSMAHHKNHSLQANLLHLIGHFPAQVRVVKI
ncbi:MAG: hypothetical protein EB102_11205 [Gammaproteobacteria bacterium]|nr:hypothetical protein [Gammaproteobacteria bacterium]